MLKNKNKLFSSFFLILTCGILMVSCGSNPNEYNVNLFDKDDVLNIDKQTAKENEDFEAVITVKDAYKEDYCVPDNVETINIGSTILPSD